MRFGIIIKNSDGKWVCQQENNLAKGQEIGELLAKLFNDIYHAFLSEEGNKYTAKYTQRSPNYYSDPFIVPYVSKSPIFKFFDDFLNPSYIYKYISNNFILDKYVLDGTSYKNLDNKVILELLPLIMLNLHLTGNYNIRNFIEIVINIYREYLKKSKMSSLSRFATIFCYYLGDYCTESEKQIIEDYLCLIPNNIYSFYDIVTYKNEGKIYDSKDSGLVSSANSNELFIKYIPFADINRHRECIKKTNKYHVDRK